jgi:Cache domain
MTGLASVEAPYARRSSLIAALRNGNHTRYRGAAIDGVLKDLQAHAPGVLVASVVDPAGVFWGESAPPFPASIIGKSFAYREWYQGAVASGEPYVAPAIVSIKKGNPLQVVTADVVMADGTYAPGTVVAVLYVGYELTQMQRLLGGFTSGQGVALEVIDQHGVMVAKPGSAPTTLVKDTAPGVSAALTGAGSVQRAGYHGRDTFAAYAPVSGIGWTVVAQTNPPQTGSTQRTLPTSSSSERATSLALQPQAWEL